MLKNPILPGFNADPCICRRDNDYYLAVSSFEWFPGVPVYHSQDLKNWQLLTHCLNDEAILDLKNLPSGKGVWAPCLTWCEADSLFYLVFGIMHSMSARYFDVDNFIITAPDIMGPWNEPIYVGSAGFDASLFHDDDGRKWLTSLEWETRPGYEQPGAICLAEYDPVNKEVIGNPKRIWSGGTDRGCIEGPHITKKYGWYYLMCAEGGTGYGHSVTVGRSRDIWGPYQSDPANPILTSAASDFNERDNSEFLKPHLYNPNSVLQKSGHASYAETRLGEVYLVHHIGRPFIPELRCTLGRETAIQKMTWTTDGWLRLEAGGNIAQEYVVPSELPPVHWPELSDHDDFCGDKLRIDWYSPRIDAHHFVSGLPGRLQLRGHESLCSLNKVSLIARKLTSVQTEITTKMHFVPEVYQHYAGLTLYYDQMNYTCLYKGYSDESGGPVLSILRLDNGVRTEFSDFTVSAPSSDVYFRLTVKGRQTQFFWSKDGTNFQKIGPVFDTSEFSDEYCKYGEFTGAFAGLFCVDALFHRQTAEFAFFEMISAKQADVK